MSFVAEMGSFLPERRSSSEEEERLAREAVGVVPVVEVRVFRSF